VCGWLQAVESLVKLVPKLPKPDVASKFVPLLKRLANGDWFTTRVSATGLFAAAYPVREQACQPAQPARGRAVEMGRSQAAATGDSDRRWSAVVCCHVAARAQLVSDPLQTELRSLFNNLCNDDTPMVRKAAFTHLGVRPAQPKQRNAAAAPLRHAIVSLIHVLLFLCVCL